MYIPSGYRFSHYAVQHQTIEAVFIRRRLFLSIFIGFIVYHTVNRQRSTTTRYVWQI